MLKSKCFNLFAIICLNSGYTLFILKTITLESEVSGQMVPLIIFCEEISLYVVAIGQRRQTESV